MPRSFGLPCQRKGCSGRCHVAAVTHSIKDEYLRRVRRCNVCGWKRRTIEVFVTDLKTTTLETDSKMREAAMD